MERRLLEDDFSGEEYESCKEEGAVEENDIDSDADSTITTASELERIKQDFPHIHNPPLPAIEDDYLDFVTTKEDCTICVIGFVIIFAFVVGLFVYMLITNH